MFDRLIRLWAVYVADIGAWHARTNYPRSEHGIAVPTWGEPGLPSVEVSTDSNVTPLRQGEAARG